MPADNGARAKPAVGVLAGAEEEGEGVRPIAMEMICPRPRTPASPRGSRLIRIGMTARFRSRWDLERAFVRFLSIHSSHGVVEVFKGPARRVCPSCFDDVMFFFFLPGIMVLFYGCLSKAVGLKKEDSCMYVCVAMRCFCSQHLFVFVVCSRCACCGGRESFVSRLKKLKPIIEFRLRHSRVCVHACACLNIFVCEWLNIYVSGHDRPPRRVSQTPSKFFAACAGGDRVQPCGRIDRNGDRGGRCKVVSRDGWLCLCSMLDKIFFHALAAEDLTFMSTREFWPIRNLL